MCVAAAVPSCAVGATPMHALCLPRPAGGVPRDVSLRPTVLYAGDVPFGGALQNFGRCAIDAAGVATFSLHAAKDGSMLFEVKLQPEVGSATPTCWVCLSSRR